MGVKVKGAHAMCCIPRPTPLVQQRQLAGGLFGVDDVWCVHGDKRPYPTARIYLEVQGQTYFLEVGVVRRLSHPLLLGQDIPLLPRLLWDSTPVNMVVTQVKAREVISQVREPTNLSHGLQ